MALNRGGRGWQEAPRKATQDEAAEANARRARNLNWTLEEVARFSADAREAFVRLPPIRPVFDKPRFVHGPIIETTIDRAGNVMQREIRPAIDLVEVNGVWMAAEDARA